MCKVNETRHAMIADEGLAIEHIPSTEGALVQRNRELFFKASSDILHKIYAHLTFCLKLWLEEGKWEVETTLVSFASCH